MKKIEKKGVTDNEIRIDNPGAGGGDPSSKGF